jgi:hypothetical protein
MFVVLSLVKVLHWLVQGRVDFLETTPHVPRLAHARISALLLGLLVSTAQRGTACLGGGGRVRACVVVVVVVVVGSGLR